ncbi:MAG: penicillin-binding protein [Rhodospirillaceae bacterium]|nr:penicillin-binding protein [Rhodospirillaceae bacterium]
MMESDDLVRDDLARSEAVAQEARRNARRIELVGTRSRAVEVGRSRLAAAAVMFGIAFLVIAGRLVDITLIEGPAEPRVAHSVASEPTVARADITDRNGVILATSLPTRSLYADPALILDPDNAADRLAAVLPELDPVDLRAKLAKRSRFVWIKRNLTPRQQAAVNALGVPGFAFVREERRVYPHGALTAHVVGFTGVDNRGLAGVERHFDQQLRSGPVTLSLDIRVQHIVRDALSKSVATFQAVGGSALVMDVRTGELLSMVSLPDFDPHEPARASDDQRFNRNTLGVYEMGSTFKVFTAAMALDAGVVPVNGGYDASEPLKVSRFTIRDYHAKNRWLSVPEILLYSSNIGAAKMAMAVGGERQQRFFDSLGLTRPLSVELSEIGNPMTPAKWREINVVTAAYGHGIAVTPLHLAAGVAAVVNGGELHPATLVKHETGVPVPGERVISAETSSLMRAMLRLVVAEGTGRKADAPGYYVGGKTGTAEKSVNGHYARKALISSFVGMFPSDNPRYLVLAMLDEPHGTKETFGYATGGWTAAPVVGEVVSRIGPMLGVVPRETGGEPEQTMLIKVRNDEAAH